MDTGSNRDVIAKRLADQLEANGPVSKCASFVGTIKTHYSQGKDEIVMRSSIMLEFEVFGVEVKSCFMIENCTEDLILSATSIKRFGLCRMLPNLISEREKTKTRAAINELITREDLAEEDEGLGKAEQSKEYSIDDPIFQKKLQLLLKAKAEVFEPLREAIQEIPGMEIRTQEGYRPKAIPPRRLSPKMEEVVENSIRELLDMGVIRPSTSEFNSPIVLVRKRDGSWRFCVDYRDLNMHTQQLSYPIPHTAQLIERLSGKRFFCVMDLASGFYHFNIREIDRHKTAFITHMGQYEFNRLSMGLKNSPPFFQKSMMILLSGLVHVGCEVYIDDLIVFGMSHDELLENLEKVLTRLVKLGFKLKQSKCHFGLTRVRYLGFEVDGNGTRIAQDRVEAIKMIARPNSTKELRSFLGITNYLRQYVPNYATAVKPLTTQMRAKRLIWNEECEAAFVFIKQSIASAPLLHHMNYERPIYVQTDASDEGIAGHVYQMDGVTIQTVCYLSKSFNDQQRRWSTIEKECFAVVYTINKCEHWLRGYSFNLLTDCKNLLWMNNSKVPKVQRWSLYLQEFTYTIHHIKGTDNCVCDGLTRLRQIEVGEETLAMLCDDEVDTWITDSIELVHNDDVGHHGVSATVRKLHEQGMEWNGMYSHVADYIALCPHCQRNKRVKEAQGELYHLSSFDIFFEVHVDLEGPLPTDTHGNRYIVVCTDGFTRFTELFPCQSDTAESVCRALLNLVGRYGIPSYIHSDRGSEFTAKLTKAFVELLEIEFRFALAHRPRANGLVERTNQEVLKHLRALVQGKGFRNRWTDALPLVQRILNSTTHPTTGYAPITLMYANRVDPNRNMMLEKPDVSRPQMVSTHEYLKSLVGTQEELERLSIGYLQKVIEQRNKDREPTKTADFKSGDYVCIRPNPSRMGEMRQDKLADLYMGPRLVIARKRNTIEVKNISTQVITEYGMERVVPFRLLPDWSAADLKRFSDAQIDEWEVAEILDHTNPTGNKSDMDFLVRWAGFDDEDNMWLPYDEVHPRLSKLLKEYAVRNDMHYDIESGKFDDDYNVDGKSH
jgi:hypothetical protein